MNRVARYCGIRVLLLAASSSVLSPLSIAQTLSWTKSTPLPEPRAGYSAGVVNGKLVIAGGTYWEGSKGHWTKKLFSASTHAFDPVTQTWEKLPDAPSPVGYAASAVAGGKLFVLGGYDGTHVNRKIFVLEYGNGRYAWRSFGDMPADRLFAHAVGVGNTIYLLGGVTQFEPFDAVGTCCTSKTAANSLLSLDTLNPKKGWTHLPPHPGAKRWGGCAVTDGKSIWMFGGGFQGAASDPVTKFDEALRYDIASRKWEVSKSLPKLAEGAPGAPLFLKDKILLIGARKVYQFNPKRLEYTELSPLPEVAYVETFVWLDNKVIGSGGENTIEGPRRRSEWTFFGKLSDR